MVTPTGHLICLLCFNYLGFMVGLWHDFCILSRLVQLERVRDRRMDMLILQEKEEDVQNV